MRWIIVPLAIFLSVSLSASWSLEPSDSSSSSTSETTPLPLSQKLKELATTLEQATNDSQSDWEILSSALTEHSRKLTELVTSLTASEQEMKSIKESLKEFERSLTDSITREATLNLRLKIWRWAGSGVILVGAAAIVVLVAR
jgi:septal ring factor EnvC (AmiA/AmiB activator)